MPTVLKLFRRALAVPSKNERGAQDPKRDRPDGHAPPSGSPEDGASSQPPEGSEKQSSEPEAVPAGTDEAIGVGESLLEGRLAQARAAELIRLNAALTRSEERYRRVAYATKEAICDYDAGADRLDWYEGKNQPFGHTRGAPFSTFDLAWWLEQIHPGDRARMMAVADKFLNGSARQDFWENEYRFRRADGSYAWVRDTSQLVRDPDGKARRALCSIQDLTPQQEARSALEREVDERRQAEKLARAQTETVTRTLEALTQEADLDKFLGLVLRTITKQLNASASTLWLRDAPSTASNLHLSWYQGRILAGDELFAVLEVPPKSCPMFEDKKEAELRDLGPLVCTQAQIQGSTANDTWMTALGIKAMLVIPLVRGESVIGTLNIHNTVRDSYTPEEMALASALAQQMTLSVELSRLAEQANQAAVAREQERVAQERASVLARTNEALRRSATNLANEPDLDPLLENVLREVVAQTQAGGGHIFIYNAGANTLRLAIGMRDGDAHRGAREDDPKLWQTPFPADVTSAFAWICESGEILRQGADGFEGKAWPGTLDWFREHGYQDAVCLALKVDKKPVGILGLVFSSHKQLTQEEIELVHALSNQAALAIQLAWLAEHAKNAAVLSERNRIAQEIHDGLAQSFTGILVQLGAAEESGAFSRRSRVELFASRVRELARDGLAEARRSVMALRPNGARRGGLDKALQELAQRTTAPGRVSCSYRRFGNTHIPPDKEHALFRIAQEAVSNALRHARPSKILITLRESAEYWELFVLDDGSGMTRLPEQCAQEGFGLESMRERAREIGGNWSISSRPGEGTCVTVRVAKQAQG